MIFVGRRQSEESQEMISILEEKNKRLMELNRKLALKNEALTIQLATTQERCPHMMGTVRKEEIINGKTIISYHCSICGSKMVPLMIPEKY